MTFLTLLFSHLCISIHAAREGGDLPFCVMYDNSCIFQSTPPVKAATSCFLPSPPTKEFQSTPPVKAATIRFRGGGLTYDISIHAAREGGDARGARSTPEPVDFNPRRP